MNKHLVQGNNMTQTLNFNNVFQTFEVNKGLVGQNPTI